MTDAELQHLFALDGGPGPALTISAADAAALIDAALDGAGFGPGGGGGGRAGEAGGGGGGGGGGATGASGGTIAAGTKLAIVAGIALVAIVVALLVWRDKQRNTVQLATQTIDAAVIDAPSGGSGTQTPSGTATAQPAVVDDAQVIEMAEDEPLPVERGKPARAKPVKPAPAKPTDRATDADDLLGEANAKRAAKQWRESDALYARVAKQAPNSLAAQTALVASGSLRLEHLGDPKGAAQRFRRALAIAPAGSLAEDARWGLAEAARANHDSAAEAAALDEFLAHHGSSPLAARARARRAELP